MADISILTTEIATDPLSRGYAGMSKEEKAADMNTAYRIRALDTLSSSQIYEATDVTEFQALGVGEQQYIRDIWGLGEAVDVRPGSKARTVYTNVLPASATLAALQAMLEVLITRGEEIGWGWVKVGHVELAEGV